MAEQRVQVAAHFKIDPAKQVIGLIEFPETVTVTTVIGEEIDVKKIPFDEAFSPAQKAQFEEKIAAQVKDALRTAQPVAAVSGSNDNTPSEQVASSSDVPQGSFDI